MQKKYVTAFCCVALTIGMILSFVKVGKAQMASVYIDPAEVTGLQIGDSFTVNVDVADVIDLAGWEFQLFYNPQVLNGTSYSEGPFLTSVQSTFFLPVNFTDHYNATSGVVHLACTTLPVTGANGDGILAKVTFKIVGAGQTVLALPLATTKLFDSTPGAPQPIPHTVTNGLVTVIGADIAVTNIQFSKTITSETQIGINVTAANQGNFSASFSVTLRYDTTDIATQSLTNMAPSTSTILTFTWDLASVPKGNYTISAYAPPIQGENNVDNNLLVDGWIKKSIPGDVNGDGKVNIVDVSLVATAYTAKPGDPRWNPNLDLDNSGLINIVDVTKVAREFGNTDP